MKISRLRNAPVLLLMFMLASVADAAVDTADGDSSQTGAALFEQHCQHCHDGSVPKAPHVISFNMMSTRSIIDAMTEGVMRQQAAQLTQDQRRDVAEYLSGVEERVSHEVHQCGSAA